MSVIIKFITSATLISLATAKVPSTSTSARTSSSTSASIPIATAVIDTTPYFIELLGFNDTNDNSDWGVTIADESNGKNYTQFNPVIIGNLLYPNLIEPPFNKCDQSAFEIQYVSTNDSANPPTLLTFDESLSLSLTWPLQEAGSNSSDCTSFKEVQTVPFGINIGKFDSYNGSIVLGGYYDANRIGSTAWHLVPESVGNSGFLETGQLVVSIMINSQPYHAVLDWNGFVVFPESLHGACSNESLVVSFPGANGQAGIDIPYDLSLRKENFTCSDDLPNGSVIDLGLMFFQAAYTYVDRAGQVYITAANDLQATSVDMAPFDANATLTLPSGVRAAAAPSPTKKSAAVSNRVGWIAVFLGLHVAWISMSV